MTARGEGGKCRSNEPMGRTGRRRELGNKQKKKKERQDRASFHFEFVFYRVSFSSSLFKRRRRFAFRVPFSFPLQYIFFFFSISRIQKLLKFTRLLWRGRGGEGRFFKLFLFLFPFSSAPPLHRCHKSAGFHFSSTANSRQ